MCLVRDARGKRAGLQICLITGAYNKGTSKDGSTNRSAHGSTDGSTDGSMYQANEA